MSPPPSARSRTGRRPTSTRCTPGTPPTSTSGAVALMEAIEQVKSEAAGTPGVAEPVEVDTGRVLARLQAGGVVPKELPLTPGEEYTQPDVNYPVFESRS